MLAEVNKIMDAFALNVVSAAKNNLAKSDNSNGDLYNSLTYNISDTDDSIEVDFVATDYAKFYDLGVQGAAPSKMPPNSISRYNKAPMSPYKFGTGSGKKGGLRGAIDKWVITKNLDNIRDPETGRFLPRKSIVFLISRSIYLTGIKASNFFSAPFEQYTRDLESDLEDALGRDIKLAFKKVESNNELIITIT